MESQCVQRIHAFMLSGLTSMPARGGVGGWEVGWVQGDLQGSISVARQRSTHQPPVHSRMQQHARQQLVAGCHRAPTAQQSPT